MSNCMRLRRSAATSRNSSTKRAKSSKGRKPTKNWFDHCPRDKIVVYSASSKIDYQITLISKDIKTVIATDIPSSNQPPLTYHYSDKNFYLKEFAPGTTHLVYVEEIQMLKFPERPATYE